MKHFHIKRHRSSFQVTQHQSALLDLHTIACRATLLRTALTHRETSSPHVFPLHLRFIEPCLPVIVQSITAVSLFLVFGHFLSSISSSAQNKSLATKTKKQTNNSFFFYFTSHQGVLYNGIYFCISRT